MTLVAGVDSSTQSCKLVICDADTGEVVRSAGAPHPAGTEVHPNRWWDALCTAISAVGGLDDVDAVSVAGQQHGMVVLDADGRVDNDATLVRYREMALAQAEAGAHLLGQSGMMDGQIAAIRDALDSPNPAVALAVALVAASQAGISEAAFVAAIAPLLLPLMPAATAVAQRCSRRLLWITTSNIRAMAAATMPAALQKPSGSGRRRAAPVAQPGSM